MRCFIHIFLKFQIHFLIETLSEQIVWPLSLVLRLSPPPPPWRRCSYIVRAVPRHARWIHRYAQDQLLKRIREKDIQTDNLYHRVKWIPVVSLRRSVFRATPWMRIYLSLFRSVDPNSPLPRWKRAGINPNKPNPSWPRWWQTPRLEDPTVKGSFWERYNDFFWLYMCLSRSDTGILSVFLRHFIRGDRWI